jgi:hypothetical protein
MRRTGPVPCSCSKEQPGYTENRRCDCGTSTRAAGPRTSGLFAGAGRACTLGEHRSRRVHGVVFVCEVQRDVHTQGDDHATRPYGRSPCVDSRVLSAPYPGSTATTPAAVSRARRPPR